MEWAATKTDATIMFADLRNFNNIINILSLNEVHQFLNDYYSHIVEAVLASGGMVNKFMGDAVLAFFGAPSQHPDDPIRALQSALDIQHRAEDISVKWRTALDFLIEIDIGISTGEVLVGNVGHLKKMEHTVIGKVVNIAAMLTDLCKKHNTNVLLDHRTHEGVRERYECRMVEETLLRGFPEPVTLYTPVRDN